MGPWQYPRMVHPLEMRQPIPAKWPSAVTKVLFWLAQWLDSAKQTEPGVDLTLLAKVRESMNACEDLYYKTVIP